MEKVSDASEYDGANNSAVEEACTMPAEEAKLRRCHRAKRAVIPASLGLAFVGFAVFLVMASRSVYDNRPPYGFVEPGIKHADVATEVQIVDDSEAKDDGENAMIAALAGSAPYFKKWFGDPKSKGFHHDGGFGKANLIAGKYMPSLQTDGCYEVHEWHPSGPPSGMSLSASVDVTHSRGIGRVLVDQSSRGGQWNFLGSFDFNKDTAQLILSNQESHCSGNSPCYTTFDAFRFVYAGPACDSGKQAGNSLRNNTFVFGKILVSVSNAPAFVEDANVVTVLKESISSLARVKSNAVSVSVSAGKRRLSTLLPKLIASVVVSYRISISAGQQPSSLVEALDSKTDDEVTDAISTALLTAGLSYNARVVKMTAVLDSADLQGILESAESVAGTPAATGTATTTPTPAPGTQSECMPATIINDFDSQVKSIVSPGAQDSPHNGLEAFRPGRVGEKPYFHDWFGDISKKDFHHDAHINKGLLQVNYTTHLPESGCYLLQEWHLGGNRYCVNYMPRRVPFHVHTADGVKSVFADQSTNGGQWNTLGLFQFTDYATVLISNAGTDDCLYHGMCYTVFDSIRLVRAGSKCDGVDRSDESLDSIADLACDTSGSLAQLRYAQGDSDANPDTAEASLVQLLDVLSPDEKTIVKAGESVKVHWQTEGIANGTDIRISVLYEDQTLMAKNYRMNSASGDVLVPMPTAAFLKTYSDVVTGGNKRFRIRVDVQHVLVELSSGWSNQLYKHSPYFTVQM